MPLHVTDDAELRAVAEWKAFTAGWPAASAQAGQAGLCRDIRQQLSRCWRFLSVAYDTRPWWLCEVWDPACDPRVPLRAHEPRGRQACYFDRIAIGWLRHGLQWHCKVGLETGALSWGTVQLRADTITAFDTFLADRSVAGPGQQALRGQALQLPGRARLRLCARQPRDRR